MDPHHESSSCQRVVGIGGLVISDDPNDLLITYSLGSCIGVAAWDGAARVAGLIHCLLPSARGAPPGSEDGAARFVDQGLIELLARLFELGARRESLVVKVAGAGQPLQDCDSFRIGPRNYAAVRKILWKNNLLIASERIGGPEPKTLSVRVVDGLTTVRSGSNKEEI